MATEGFPETTRSQGQLRQHVPEGPASSRDLWGLTSCSPDPTREGLGHDWSDWAQLTAPATHAVLTSVLPLLIQTCSQVPRPRRVHQRPGAGPAILTTSNVLSFGRMCSVLPSHRPNPTSSELFLMRSPAPLLPDPGPPLLSASRGTGPVLFSSSSSGNTSGSCLYGSVSRLILLPRFVFVSPPPSVLLGRKVMTNPDSILKSRDVTLPTKVRLVKAMVFPVVMYGCESWTVKKVEP